MMITVTIKNLQGETFIVECDANDTVYNMKKVIAETSKIEPKYDADLIKLLCTGKVMDDEEVVRDFEIKPDSFLVLVRQKAGKPKPPPKKKFNQGLGSGFNAFNNNDPFMSSSLKSNAFGSQPFGQHSLQPHQHGLGAFNANAYGGGGPSSGAFSMGQYGTGASASASAGSSHTTNPGGMGGLDLGSLSLGGGGLPSSFGGSGLPSSLGGGGLPSSFGATAASNSLADTSPEAFSTPEDRAQALETLLAIGFPKSKCEQALRATFYNVEAAAELIASNKLPQLPTPASTSVPPQIKKPPTTPGLHLTSPASVVPPSPPQPTPGTGMGGSLQEMLQLLQNNPERLQMVKDAVKEQHPEIAQLIDSDPQGFLQLLNQASGSGASASSTSTGGTSASTSSSTPSGQSGTPVRVTLSTYEQEIIQRLVDMGFDRNRAIEAFLACDRNENHAANYLLNSL